MARTQTPQVEFSKHLVIAHKRKFFAYKNDPSGALSIQKMAFAQGMAANKASSPKRLFNLQKIERD